MKETAVQYLKRMVFPYLTHEEKMLTGKFFYEAEMMEKEQIVEAYDAGLFDGTMDDVNDRMHKQYYNETYGK